MKCKAKLIPVDELTKSKNKTIVGSILNWINERQKTAAPDTINDAIFILTQIAKVHKKGQNILHKYGCKDFFMELRKNAKDDQITKIDDLLTSLFHEVDEEDKENSSIASNTDSQWDANSERSQITMENVGRKSQFEDTLNDRDFNNKFGLSSFSRQAKPTNTPQLRNYEEVKRQPKISENMPLRKNDEKKTAFNPTECLQNKKNCQRTYIELEKEHCELPYITLSDKDEDLLSD